MSLETLLDDPEIEVIVNLSPPSSHHEISRCILEAGKHLYTEKPFAVRLEDALDLMALAEAKGLLIGCAPDTFLGEGSRATRQLVDTGLIGKITGGSMAFATCGMESWHPDPAFFYADGGGPLLDIGPYYVTQLVNLLGPVAEVSAIGTSPRTFRTTTRPGCERETIAVKVPTSVTGSLLFASGANISLALSWDVQAHGRAAVELYGEDGTIEAPDPTHYSGRPRVFHEGKWNAPERATPLTRTGPTLADMVCKVSTGIDPLAGGPAGPETMTRLTEFRGLGLIDLADAVRSAREPRCSPRLAYHVLETLLALQSSARDGGRIHVRSIVERPSCVVTTTASPEPA